MPGLSFRGLQPLFFSPLAQFELAEPQALNERLLAEARARRAASAGLKRSNWAGWHSEDDFFERTEAGAVELRAHIADAVRQCTLALAPQFDFDRYAMQAEGWINILEAGGLNTPHDHPAWVWSGCYYVQVPGDDAPPDGCIEFLDSRTNIRTLTVDGAACFASKFNLQPRAGMLLIFPSYLRHWVYPHRAAGERVSIAFNVRFVAR